jgi:hypothetical protein
MTYPMLSAFCLAPLMFAGAAHAAPEDRGQRGWYVGGGGGLAVGAADDVEGESAGSFLGNMGRLRVGEEAIPNLYVGLAVMGGGLSADRYDAGFGGLFLEAGWRALPSALPDLVFLVGAGVGGGSLEAKDAEDELDSAPGGAMYELGLMWEFEFGDEPEGFVLAPAVHWYYVPPQFENEAQLSTVLISVEALWYGGR